MSDLTFFQSIFERSRRQLALFGHPLKVFAISRLGLAVVAYLSLILIPFSDMEGVWRWQPNNLFLDGWVRWDSAWYSNIVTQGYLNEANDLGQTNTPFFPLYPLLIRLLQPIFGGPYLSGLFVANVSFLLALLVLYRLVGRHYPTAVANKTVTLMAFSPFSFFFSAMYTESLFLLSVVGAFALGEQKRWFWAGLCAAAAGATRAVGIFTILGLILLYLEQVAFDWRRVRADILWTLLGFAGLGGFILHLELRLGRPLAFVTDQLDPAWRGNTESIQSILSNIRASLSLGALAAGEFPAMNLIHLLALVLALVLCMVAWRQPRRAYAVWGLITILASTTVWQSMGRFSLVVFPIFIAAALYLRDEQKYQFVLALSVMLLSLFTILFSHFYWVA